jgi:hypothetical protein
MKAALSHKQKQQFRELVGLRRLDVVPDYKIERMMTDFSTALSTLSPEKIHSNDSRGYAWVEHREDGNSFIIIAIGPKHSYDHLLFDYRTGAFLRKETHEEIKAFLSLAMRTMPELHERIRVRSIVARECLPAPVGCGRPVRSLDPSSEREFRNSALCKACQDAKNAEVRP